jgi:hypothetical protein
MRYLFVALFVVAGLVLGSTLWATTGAESKSPCGNADCKCADCEGKTCKCGESKCGEGKCGADKCADSACSAAGSVVFATTKAGECCSAQTVAAKKSCGSEGSECCKFSECASGACGK